MKEGGYHVKFRILFPTMKLKELIIIKLLSIDLSLASSGIAIFNNNELIHYEKIVTNKKDFENEDLRMNYIGNKIDEIINKYKIDTIVCENQFGGNNNQTILALRKLLGVISRVAYKHNIIPTYYLPSSWRKVLNINKGKSKDKKILAYEFLIKEGINIGEFHATGKDKNDDIVDSICIGLAYLKKNGGD